ncbi:MAG: hypothetical protein COU51_02135 [Parcubacteria group bacterium CG10_big_fil_rev_8_21_14_0_10_36_14]|nr:MAG: hypothetical protein COU51_02135 [Parcubacteria group bacterium CG10_big_fil_rev_8_21_14_0_10_36_14]
MSDEPLFRIEFADFSQPEIKMCDCGSLPPHAYIILGDFRSAPISAKYWGRGLLKVEPILSFGEDLARELLHEFEKLPLPERGPRDIECEFHPKNSAIKLNPLKEDQ